LDQGVDGDRDEDVVGLPAVEGEDVAADRFADGAGEEGGQNEHAEQVLVRFRFEPVLLAEDEEPEHRRQDRQDQPDQDQRALAEPVGEAFADDEHDEGEEDKPRQQRRARRPIAAAAEGRLGVVLAAVGTAAEAPDATADRAVANDAGDLVVGGGDGVGLCAH
jgi:hypothetical protein